MRNRLFSETARVAAARELTRNLDNEELDELREEVNSEFSIAKSALTAPYISTNDKVQCVDGSVGGRQFDQLLKICSGEVQALISILFPKQSFGKLHKIGIFRGFSRLAFGLQVFYFGIW